MAVVHSHRILVVDDEAGVRDVVKRYLEREGFDVAQASTGAQAMQALDEGGPFDLIVLDVMLPGPDGLAILRRARAAGDTPVIMLSARSEEFDRVLGLEMGADDYVPKPFSPRELVSRVKAVLRRAAREAPAPPARRTLVLGGLALDLEAREATVDGTPRELTAREFDLLLLLMRHPRQVFTREQLLEQVWGYADYIDASTVTVHIHRLRDKIERDPSHPVRLVTVWGVGYRLEAAE
jgi:DNA-binding response OmpR family regulator